MSSVAAEAQDAVLNKVLSVAPLGIAIGSSDGSPPVLNAQAVELVGPAMSGECLLLHRDGRPYAPHEWPLARALHGEVVVAEDAKAVSRGGRVTHLRLAAHPVHDRSGRVVSAVATFQDRSTQPTISEFLANLSYELRTPMNAILGWIRLLSKGGLTRDGRAAGLGVVERSVSLQIRLIEDLLDTSLLVAGKLAIRPRPVDPRVAIAMVLESSRSLASLRGISLTARVDPACPEIVIDSNRLQQVVRGMLSNAIKSTPMGGSITLEVAQVGGQLRIDVSDSGGGMEPPLLKLISEELRLADGAPLRRLGGQGLGLQLLKNMVDLLGGSVEAHSDGPGRGSTFVVSLPAELAPALSPSGASEPFDAAYNARIGEALPSRPPPLKKLRVGPPAPVS